MGIFDDTYDSSDSLKSVVWTVITAIIGCVFIAKRLYFANQAKRLGKNNVNDEFLDIIVAILLVFGLIQIVYGPPNTSLTKVFIFIFTMNLIIGLGKLFNMFGSLVDSFTKK